MQAQGLKPALNLGPLRGAEAPLFHSTTHISAFFRNLLGLCGQRLPELNLIPIQVIDPGKATVGFIHSFGVNLYSLLF